MAEQLDASTSLGAAIGLSGTPKDYSGQFANMAYRQQAGQQKKQAAEKKASEKAYKMFDLKPGAMLRGREEDTKHRLGVFYENMSGVAANREDPKTNPAIQRSHAENLMHLDSVAKEREAFYKDLELAKANPDKFTINEEVFNVYAGGKSYGEDVPYYQAGTMLIPNGNPQKRISELGAAVKPKKTTTDTVNQITGNVEQIDIEEIDPADNLFWAQKFYEGAVNGTDIDGAVGLQNIKKNYGTKGSPLYDPKFNLLAPEDQDELVKKKFVDEAVRGFEAVQSQTNKFNITRPSKINININTGANGDLSKPVGTGAKELNIAYTDERGNVKQGSTKSLDGFTFQPLKLEATLPVSATNMNNNEKIKDLGTQKISGGEIQLLYAYRKGTKDRTGKVDISNLILPDQNITEEQLASGSVEAMPFFIGKIEKRDQNGELKETQFYAPAKDIVQNVNVLGESGKEDKAAVIQMYGGIKQKADAENKRLSDLHLEKFPNDAKSKKTPKRITGKSKSGKNIYSDDNGKTWNYE